MEAEACRCARQSRECPASAIASLVNTYGKTWHTWQIDKNSALQVGIPQLIMGFLADGQLKPEMIQSRDKELGIRTADVKKARADLAGSAPQLWVKHGFLLPALHFSSCRLADAKRAASFSISADQPESGRPTRNLELRCYSDRNPRVLRPIRTRLSSRSFATWRHGSSMSRLSLKGCLHRWNPFRR
ncbi:DUF1264 domain-containing protein [Nitrobacter winogradskyi]|uniref:DUF1264 domain-containing protein n=1 Tax=Nitrobacter winogradskyi TaxID=913 RepID=UPI0011435D11